MSSILSLFAVWIIISSPGVPFPRSFLEAERVFSKKTLIFPLMVLPGYTKQDNNF